MELIRLGDPAHGIVTKTVHKTLPGGGGVQGVGKWVDMRVVGSRGWVGRGMVGVQGWVGRGSGG